MPQRVAQFLVAGIERGGGQSLAVRQTDIAETLGVTREAVAAALRRLREARLIDTRYRVIDVLDLDGLRRAMESGAAV
ncbi:helix-turn-helix domain-containing protein [Caballeronia sp. ATUFL_M2_KS44]|uniref:Crp/Fnr family transcriptional regulator n=1 Tax=Caballeronia sp. ATUFL_M2_KS44 TaxID=2921767 RepID=UPI00202901D8